MRRSELIKGGGDQVYLSSISQELGFEPQLAASFMRRMYTPPALSSCTDSSPSVRAAVSNLL